MTLPAGARALVVTVSDRSAAGERADRSGPLAVELLREMGFEVRGPVVVPDNVGRISHVLREAEADAVDVVVTTGGTGFGPRDVTPEATRLVVQREAPGLADALRSAGLPAVPMAVLSRGIAGIAGTTLVVNLAGSTGAVRDGMGVLAPLLGHAVAQLRGADHADPYGGAATGAAGSG